MKPNNQNSQENLKLALAECRAIARSEYEIAEIVTPIVSELRKSALEGEKRRGKEL
jgi:hypothetical protein